MILKASQRSGALALGRHLLKAENEHVELHDVRGFIADDVIGAFQEAEAISKGTRCKQFLFSLSLNPPEQADVEVGVFEDAIGRVERQLKLEGQPRVVVFHEKEGRRHAHCVWSRIDAETMRAINLPHFKRKLTALSRELYLEHEWKMPDGLVLGSIRDPLTFNLQDWQQAKRGGHDPKLLKAFFQRTWEISDSGKAFRAGIERHGFKLALGDQRGFVAVDRTGEVYAIARQCGVRAKAVTERLATLESIPTVATAKRQIAEQAIEKIDGFSGDLRKNFAAAAKSLEARRLAMTEQHRTVRKDLARRQEDRAAEEARTRAMRFRKGLAGLWDRLVGRHAKLRAENEADLASAEMRDRDERQALIARQLEHRRQLQREIRSTRATHQRLEASLDIDRRDYRAMLEGESSPRRKLRTPSRQPSGPT